MLAKLLAKASIREVIEIGVLRGIRLGSNSYLALYIGYSYATKDTAIF